MLPPTIAAVRLDSRRAILWLLACLIALQGMSVNYLVAKGPAHIHRDTSLTLVLEDVRRVGSSPFVLRPAAESWFGHHHGAALRHHHAASDSSIVLMEADRIADATAEDSSVALDIAAAAFVAVMMPASMWTPSSLSHRRASSPTWQPSFETARLIERPPQRA